MHKTEQTLIQVMVFVNNVSILTHQFSFIFFKFFKCLFIFERQRQSVIGGGAEGEGDTESEAGSRLRAVSTEPDAELELTHCEVMT